MNNLSLVYKKLDLSTLTKDNYKKKYEKYIKSLSFLKPRIHRYNKDNDDFCVLLKGFLFKENVASRESINVDFSFDVDLGYKTIKYFFISLYSQNKDDEDILIYRNLIDGLMDFRSKNVDENICLIVFMNGEYFESEMLNDNLREFNKYNLIISNKDTILNDIIQNLRQKLIESAPNNPKAFYKIYEIENIYLANYELNNIWN